MTNQEADGQHISASYMIVIILVFKDGESMREGLMFIVDMRKTKPLKRRSCRQYLRNILGGMYVSRPRLLRGRSFCCIVHQFEQISHRNGWPRLRDIEDEYIYCDLCSCDIELDYVLKITYYTNVWY